MKERVDAAVKAIRRHTGQPVRVGLILGSGLGDLADEVQDPVILPYREIPGFPVSAVAGHAGVLVVGRLEGVEVAVMKGRAHYYEGHSMAAVSFPVRVLRALGAQELLITNASGGISRALRPGDLALITDHVNLTGDNPLRGPNDDRLGPRFPTMSRAYDPELRALARKVAEREGIDLRQGVYCGLAGPSYETPAEVRFLSRIGVDMVGMSTVPETIVAVHCGLRVLGISCITNVLYGEPSEDTHQEVLRVAAAARPFFIRLVRAVLRELP